MGKTRLLKKIRLCLDEKPPQISLEAARAQNESYSEIISSFENSLRDLTSQANSLSGNKVRELDEKRENYVRYLKRQQRIFEWNYLETDSLHDVYGAIDFVPKGLNLHDCEILGRAEIKSLATNIKVSGFDYSIQSTFAAIQYAQDYFSVRFIKKEISATKQSNTPKRL